MIITYFFYRVNDDFCGNTKHIWIAFESVANISSSPNQAMQLGFLFVIFDKYAVRSLTSSQKTY